MSGRPPLLLETFGQFFVGGSIDGSVEGEPMAGQAYVEYWVPAELRSSVPVVMLHGGRQMGTNFTATPDGREGWAQYFLRRGSAVYVMDQVARGRSPHWSLSQGPMAPHSRRGTESFMAPALFGLWPQAELHTRWPGSAEPGDRSYEQFYASQSPQLADGPRGLQLSGDALVALLEEVGESVLLTHSQSAHLGWYAADVRPDLVKAIVAVEPNGPPVYDVDFTGPPDWFTPTDPHKTDPHKASGISPLPLTYDPPLGPEESLEFVVQDRATGPDLVPCWLQREPARQLVNLSRVPILVLTAEASRHSGYDHCTVFYLEQAGVEAAFIRLADIGIHGNGHMMMLETNSDSIAAVIHDWLSETLGT